MTTGFGIDIGGTGIKGAPVDLDSGTFTADRVRIDTPDPATPEAVAEVVRDLVEQFPDVDGSVGITMPSVVKNGVVHSAANIDKSWIGVDADRLFTDILGREVHVINDADAAGLAELQYGAARNQTGVVLVTTLGTGIGSALLNDGVLVPNTELGHFELHGKDAEKYAANSAREKHDLSWKEWGERLTDYYGTMERLFSPELIVVGGGVSKQADEFLPFVKVETPLVPAVLRNKAGIAGAAYFAEISDPH